MKAADSPGGGRRGSVAACSHTTDSSGTEHTRVISFGHHSHLIRTNYSPLTNNIASSCLHAISTFNVAGNTASTAAAARQSDAANATAQKIAGSRRLRVLAVHIRGRCGCRRFGYAFAYTVGSSSARHGRVEPGCAKRLPMKKPPHRPARGQFHHHAACLNRC
jgi:hypothetical protein